MKRKKEMTLNRVFSRLGIASRQVACGWIHAGRVKVNGRTVRDPEMWVNRQLDAIHLDGKRLKQAHRIYLLFYKPKGVITSYGDPEDRETVYHYLESGLPWVVPVGRLDRDTSGLLLLTNDTDFADFITNPSSGIHKTYLVRVNGIVTDENIAALASGVRMNRGDWAHPRSVRRLEERGRYSKLEVVLDEGKNREVRRMMEALGFKVLKLVRTGIGPLTMEGLEVGKYRKLKPREISALRGAKPPCAPRA